MGSKTFRTCEIIKDGYFSASCELKFIDNRYLVIVKDNSEDLFVDFDLEIKNNEDPANAIKHFELECLKRFTCNSEFTLKELKEYGEEISFY